MNIHKPVGNILTYIEKANMQFLIYINTFSSLRKIIILESM